MSFEKQKKCLISFAYYGLIAAAVYCVVRFLVPPLMPFLLGALVAWVLHRPATFLTKKLHLPQKMAPAILTAVFYFLVLMLISMVGGEIGSALGTFLPTLPNRFVNQFLPFFNESVEVLKNFIEKFDIAAASQIDEWFREFSSAIIQTLTNFSTTAVKFVSSVAAAAPSIILKIVLTVISTFYFALDFDRIMSFLHSLLPMKAQKLLHTLKEKSYRSLKIFATSYILVFVMTFTELSLGFWILGIPYPALVGLVVAVVDILPVLGTGLVLLPWSVIGFLMRDFKIGIGMLVLYIVITVVRNIVEPRLVGGQIGLHPLATLIAMFVGLQMFGLIGLIGFPVTLSIVVQLESDEGSFLRKKIEAVEEKNAAAEAAASEEAGKTDAPKE